MKPVNPFTVDDEEMQVSIPDSPYPPADVETQMQRIESRMQELQSQVASMRAPSAGMKQRRSEARPPRVSRRTKLANLVEAWSPWLETDNEEIDGLAVQTKKEPHASSHGACMGLYLLLISAYAVEVIVRFVQTPTQVTFSSEKASEFGPLDLNVTLECDACGIHAEENAKYKIMYDYPSGPCRTDGTKVATDQETILPLCEGGNVRAWVGNISEEKYSSPGRAWVRTRAPGVDIMTPLESWHEKSILFGLTVRRNDDDCHSAGDCDKFERELFLSNKVYDGKVNWGGDRWGGGQLNIMMLEYANIYTEVPSRTPMDLMSDIGGASGLLIFVLGLLRKSWELGLHLKGKLFLRFAGGEEK